MKFSDVLENSAAYGVFKRDIEADRLKHCYMFISEDAAAVENLAVLCAASVQCPEKGCFACLECRKVFDGNHQNVYYLPDKASVADAREMQADMKNAFDGIKTYVIKDVSALSPEVQNTLLKTLEEPRSGAMILMGASNESRVPETVKSRAEKIFLERFPAGVVSDALKDITDDEEAVTIAAECSGGLLFKAEKIAENKQYIVCHKKVVELFSELRNSKQLAKFTGSLPKDGESSQIILEIVEKLIENMILYKTGLKDVSADAARISEKYSVRALSEFADLTVAARAKLNSNCQAAGVMEQLFLSILEVAYKCR